MTNVKISPKGKALLQKSNFAREIVSTIARKGEELTKKEGLTIVVKGQSIKLRAATQKVDFTSK